MNPQNTPVLMDIFQVTGSASSEQFETKRILYHKFSSLRSTIENADTFLYTLETSFIIDHPEYSYKTFLESVTV